MHSDCTCELMDPDLLLILSLLSVYLGLYCIVSSLSHHCLQHILFVYYTPVAM